jgi:beta-lactam-binding protein with PASTA domain
VESNAHAEKQMKKAWKTRQFWRTIALMVAASLLIVILTIFSLRIFSRHGQSYIVPDLTGLSMGHLTSLEKDYRFKFVVIDSVFDQTQPPGTVVRHDPLPGSTVKRGRKFYVTLVSTMPDMVTMPNLVDLSLRQAISRLEATGLHLGTITYKPDYQFQNAVLDQIYRGKPIAFGEKIRRGSYVNLVVSGTQQSNFDEEENDEDYEIEFSDEF